MTKNKENGQALITLIFFVVIAVSITTAAVAVVFTNNLATTTQEQGLVAYYAAESGAEDGLLRLLRDPTYTGTYQPLGSGDNQEAVTITGNTITSTGTSGEIIRKIQIQTVYTNGKLKISSWKEIN